jgi:hypothetical protein
MLSSSRSEAPKRKRAKVEDRKSVKVEENTTPGGGVGQVLSIVAAASSSGSRSSSPPPSFGGVSYETVVDEELGFVIRFLIAFAYCTVQCPVLDIKSCSFSFDLVVDARAFTQQVPYCPYVAMSVNVSIALLGC